MAGKDELLDLIGWLGGWVDVFFLLHNSSLFLLLLLLHTGTAAFLSSLICGLLPLLPYCFSSSSSSLPFYLSLFFSLLLLLFLGFLKAHLLEQGKGRTVGGLVGLGVCVGALSFGLGKGFHAVL